MAGREKLTCSDLKKLQLNRRRTKAGKIDHCENRSPLSLNTSISKSENDKKQNMSFINPFIKDQAQEFNESESVTTISTESVEPHPNLSFKESDYMIVRNIQKVPESDTQSGDFRSNLNDLYVEKSLKTSIIFESDKCLSHWQMKFSNPLYLLQSMRDPGNENIAFYYRYPDVTLPTNQKKIIHKAISNNSMKMNSRDENLIWYRMFSEKWRKALLSAFETLKHGFVQMFYFVLENLTVLFERDPIDGTLKAYMQLTSPALAEDFKKNDIEFRILSKTTSEESAPPPAEIVSLSTEPVSETEDFGDFEQFIPDIQTKRVKAIFTKEDIVIEGGLSAAELVDFLINQKDRNSYAILPEIYSPGPFIHGTLRSNNIVFSGPCKGADSESIYQLKVGGVSFPNSICALIKELKSSGHSISLSVERENNTDFLSAYAYNN